MRALVLLAILTAVAQAQPVLPKAVLCTYETCAIRLEGTFFGGTAVVRGPVGEGERLGRVGVLLNGLEVAVADVPAATEHARAARRYRTGSLATSALAAVVIGTTLGSVFYRDLFEVDEGPTGGELAIYAGGVALAVVSTGLELKSRNEQSRAVWEYNRATVAR